jgi:hypothetical protein
LESLALEDVGILYDLFGLFCGNWVNCIAIWFVLWAFGIFSPFLVRCVKIHLATLCETSLAVHRGPACNDFDCHALLIDF